MPKITDLLRIEHEAILKILEILDANAQKAAGGVRIEPEIMDGLMRCLKDYVDPCHQMRRPSCFRPWRERVCPERRGPWPGHGPTIIWGVNSYQSCLSRSRL